MCINAGPCKGSYHWCALVWTGTSGRYFLYGRLRDIISTEPKSSRMLTYCRGTKSRRCSKFIYNSFDTSFIQLNKTRPIILPAFSHLRPAELHGHLRQVNDQIHLRRGEVHVRARVHTKLSVGWYGTENLKSKARRSHDKTDNCTLKLKKVKLQQSLTELIVRRDGVLDCDVLLQASLQKRDRDKRMCLSFHPFSHCVSFSYTLKWSLPGLQEQSEQSTAPSSRSNTQRDYQDGQAEQNRTQLIHLITKAWNGFTIPKDVTAQEKSL